MRKFCPTSFASRKNLEFISLPDQKTNAFQKI